MRHPNLSAEPRVIATGDVGARRVRLTRPAYVRVSAGLLWLCVDGETVTGAGGQRPNVHHRGISVPVAASNN